MSLITRTDVTAVIFYKNFILAGIGSTLHLFDKTSMTLRQRLIALHGEKIYGIVPSKCREKIIVFGGKQFTVLYMDVNKVLYKEFEAVVCDDWLHSALWVENDTIVVLTAHNVVQKWNTKTLKLLSEYASKDNSILYSGLLLPVRDDILVMAGTVFSEIIIHRCGDELPLHNLKGHKGVIFSISCKPEKDIIVTTSDDRAVRIWGPDITPSHPYDSIDYWKNINIVCKREIYGHLARVMRSCITNNLIISIGEDSTICYWDYEGKLKKKTVTHQNGCIWSVDSDGEHLVTGGGDSGVILHPLTVATNYSKNKIISVNVATPKIVEFTARRNLVITDENNLVYYDFVSKNKTVHELKHPSTYMLLALSSCKQIIAVADMTGKLDVFVETCKENAVIIKIVDITLNLGKILSMHWAGNRHIVFSSDDGHITVFASNNNNIEKYADFQLAPCKEGLLTAAAIDYSKNNFVVGDRSGNIHIFVKGYVNAIKSFSKIHGRYGPRSLTVTEHEIISTGRDHSIKYFSNNNGNFKFMHSKDLPFSWVEKFLDKDQNLVCGFQERVFVVYNVKDNSKVLEIPCGGGHRSFDAIRYIDKVNDEFDEIIKLVYLKDSDINVATFELSKIMSKNVVNGSHAKEINCLNSHKVKAAMIFISGGEDTTLRISSINAAMHFQDEVSFRHLSSIRTLKTYLIDRNTFLLVSAGGRAQICVKKVKIIDDKSKIDVVSEKLIDYLIKGTDKERKGNQPWKNCYVDFDPEMRIMDLDVIKAKDKFLIFAGCSDSYLRVFSFVEHGKKLDILKASEYHTTCILKTNCMNIFDKDILVTCTTRGEITFWDATNILERELTPFFTTKTNKSGINSFVSKIIDTNKVLIVTGGDDNTIHLALLEIPEQNNLNSIKILNTWNSSSYHSSQITGLCLVDDVVISASIDQRITILRFRIADDEIECDFVNQMYTDVADVQGMDLVDCTRIAPTLSCRRKPPLLVKPIGRTNHLQEAPLTRAIRTLNLIAAEIDLFHCTKSEFTKMAPVVEPVTEPVWLGEGPHWDAGAQALYFVSIFDRTINKYEPGTTVHTSANLDGMPTFIIPVEGKKHHFVVGLDRKVVEVRWDGGVNSSEVVRTVAEVDADRPQNRFNDAKADPMGRLFAGTMGHEYEPGKFLPKQGSLYRIDPNGSVHRLESNIDISNGLCWDLKEKAFYFADSLEYAIRRYDYDVGTGNISNPRQIFVYKDHGLAGIADGMTLDTDGNLWVANFDGYQVLKIDPRTGKLLQKVPIPARQVTSATFGGSDLDILYVTTAAMNRGVEQPPPCGATFRVAGLGVIGTPNVNVRLD